MSSTRKPRQILGANNSNAGGEIISILLNNNESSRRNENYMNLNGQECQQKLQKLKENFEPTSPIRKRLINPNIEDELFVSNRSKYAVATNNFENGNRMRWEEMASYWPYTAFMPPYCVPPQYGLIAHGSGVPYPLPFFPTNPNLMAASVHDTRKPYSSDSMECGSSIGANSSCSSIKSAKIVSQNASFKNDENKMNSGANITLSQKQFVELTRLAMRGSETAERIAYTHRNRPCFKKIDSLCARMKQDLIRPDGVLPNINSQGIAWAVKDFIFVFTRVINAWIIIKGYVYNTPEGLNKIKASLSSDFLESFAAWQDSTMDFVESLIKSFVNLDQLVQSQKTPFAKNETSSKSDLNTPIKLSDKNSNIELSSKFDDSFDFTNSLSDSRNTSETGSSTPTNTAAPLNVGLNKSYYSTLVEDSEESQRRAIANGTYFKTGVYNPIWKDSVNEMDSLFLAGRKDSVESINLTLEKSLPIAFGTKNFEDNSGWPNHQPESEIDLVKNKDINSMSYGSPKNGEGDGKLCDLSNNNFSEPIQNKFFSYDFKVLEKNVSKFSNYFDSTTDTPIGQDTVNKLEILLKRIQNLPEGNLFFEERFMKNYFPDLMSKCSKFLDLRSIFLKAQVGGYAHLNEFFQDLKLITYYVQMYLKTAKNDMLEIAIKKYDAAIDNIIKDELVKDLNFKNDNEFFGKGEHND